MGNGNSRGNLPRDQAREKGDWDRVSKWFASVEKDDELADNIEAAVEHIRKNFKLKRVKL